MSACNGAVTLAVLCMVRIVAAGVLGLALLLFTTSCGASSPDQSSTVVADAADEDPAASIDLGDVSAAVPELDYLDGVADLRYPTSVVWIEVDGGVFDLPDGSRLGVPAGSVASPVELRVSAVDVRLGDYVEAAPELTVFALSTAEDVTLATPLVLELATDPASISVLAKSDGEWFEVEPAPGATTRLEFDHFSTQLRAVSTHASDRIVLRNPDQARVDAAATKLRVCLQFFQLREATDYYDWVDAEEEAGRRPFPSEQHPGAGFWNELGLRVCVDGIVHDLAGGERVSVACVGERIADAASIAEAVDSCIQDTEEADENGADEPASPPDPEADNEIDDTTQSTEMRRYLGPALINLTYAVPPDTFGVTTTCVTDPSVELLLEPNGTAKLTVYWTDFVKTPGTGEGCRAVDYSEPSFGTWTGDTFDVFVRSPFRGEEAPMSGSITGDLATFSSPKLTWPIVELPGRETPTTWPTGTIMAELERVDQ